LSEWDENVFTGKEAVLQANADLFGKFEKIGVLVKARGESGNISLNEIVDENLKHIFDDGFKSFVIVSKDADFHQRSLLYGHPPKFIYLRIGNIPTSKIIEILRDNFLIIVEFFDSETESLLILS